VGPLLLLGLRLSGSVCLAQAMSRSPWVPADHCALHESGDGPSETCRPQGKNVGFQGQSGKHMLALSSSQFDPKPTCTASVEKIITQPLYVSHLNRIRVTDHAIVRFWDLKPLSRFSTVAALHG
jgi:hypothetical protein